MMLGDLGSLRVCKICMNSLGWWERAAQGGLGQGREGLPTSLPGRNSQVQASSSSKTLKKDFCFKEE